MFAIPSCQVTLVEELLKSVLELTILLGPEPKQTWDSRDATEQLGMSAQLVAACLSTFPIGGLKGTTPPKSQVHTNVCLLVLRRQ